MFDETSFLESLHEGTFTLAVVGLGYVGLPLCLTFVERTRFFVRGLDVDEDRIAQLRDGRSPLPHLTDDRVKAALETGRFLPSLEPGPLTTADVVLIAVPTPLNEAGEPDLSNLLEATSTVTQHLRPGQLVIVESSTYPGTTEHLLRPRLERSGLSCGTDFLLAYSPEREDPGNAQYRTATIPKLVGGTEPRATALAQRFYEQALDRVIPVGSARLAEAAKLTENVFRAVNIALVNELKLAFDKMEIDIWDVLDAAATKPFGFMRFSPGPGLGGHCIPIDPVYLSWAAKQHGGCTPLIDQATAVGRSIPEYVARKLFQALKDRDKVPQQSRVLFLGVAYKKNIADTRESPAHELLAQLRAESVAVSYHDPWVSGFANLRSQPLTRELLASHDATVVLTDHEAFDYRFIAAHARLIIDTRGVYRQPLPHVVKA